MVWLLALAACPRTSEHKPVEPPGKHDAGSHTLVPQDSDGATPAIALPPAPAVPGVPAGLPGLPADFELATPERVALGELLFWDVRLSTSGKLACATCHDPAHGYAGSSQHPAPAIVDAAWTGDPDWIGDRSGALAALGAHAGRELGEALPVAVAGIADLPLYRAQFERVFASEHLSKDVLPVNGDTAVIALAAFVVTRFAGDAPWDRVEREPAPPADLKAGYQLFMGKARCAQCHVPPLYTDRARHRVGPVAPGGHASAQGWRTPTLRGAADRSVFFHDASAPTLAAAIDAHLAGGGELPKLALAAAEQQQLVAFVTALTAKAPASVKPALP
jgi:cytochrome c peroxidase